MCVFKYHAFIYFLRPPPWYGTITFRRNFSNKTKRTSEKTFAENLFCHEMKILFRWSPTLSMPRFCSLCHVSTRGLPGIISKARRHPKSSIYSCWKDNYLLLMGSFLCHFQCMAAGTLWNKYCSKYSIRLRPRKELLTIGSICKTAVFVNVTSVKSLQSKKPMDW
jgi:hypothetical protein